MHSRLCKIRTSPRRDANFGVSLRPSWDHLGAILGQSWGHLGPSWAIMGHLGVVCVCASVCNNIEHEHACVRTCACCCRGDQFFRDMPASCSHILSSVLTLRRGALRARRRVRSLPKIYSSQMYCRHCVHTSRDTICLIRVITVLAIFALASTYFFGF